MQHLFSHGECNYAGRKRRKTHEECNGNKGSEWLMYTIEVMCVSAGGCAYVRVAYRLEWL